MNHRPETVVLDSQGLSAWISQDRAVLAMIRSFHSMAADLVACANTIVEVMHAQVNTAAGLLKEVGLHGHKYAIDATVAELALRQPDPVAMPTSDIDDMAKLCHNRVRLIAI
ncbi:DNA-binding protein [Streptomyces sp. NPDC014734]|uniref:DNA-binding protein n=1 Tax=Streptomyces sp. NPDC014734 TaxID=3364886 RepID=UPI0036FBBA2E